MTIDADDLAVIQSWCGTTIGTTHTVYTAADIEARLARHDTPLAVALEVLRQRRADMLADPAAANLQGDFSRDVTANLRHLDTLIAQLEAAVGDPAGTVTPFDLEPRIPRR